MSATGPAKAARRTHAETVLARLEGRAQTTAMLHAACILNPAVAVMRLRRLGHVIDTETLPSGMASYSLKVAP